MKIRFTILAILLCTVFSAKSQDIHFTSFDFAPLTINPSLSGAFLGTYRVGGIYRDQWRSVSSAGAYKTVNLHIDMPVIRGFRKKDWVGIGVNIFNDNSNTYNLNTTKSFQGLSYHLSLDKKQTQVLSFGIQNNVTSRKVNLRNRNLNTESFIRSGDSTDDDLVTNNNNRTLTDWVGGVMYSQYLRNQSFVRAGFSLGNITGRSQSIANSTDRKKLHYVAFVMYDMPLRGNLFLTPQAFYQRKGNNQELLTQVKASYLLDASKNIYLNAGVGYRWGDAINLIVGADYKDFKVQFAYDANVSGLAAASRTIGAFELGVSYIGKVYKKPKPDPTEVCPRF